MCENQSSTCQTSITSSFRVMLAVLLSKLLNFTRKTLQISDVYAWTDSKIILSCPQGHPYRWKRLQLIEQQIEIHNNIEANVWHHIKYTDNAADCVSRGVDPTDLQNHPLWWTGPTWLHQQNKGGQQIINRLYQTQPQNYDPLKL